MSRGRETAGDEDLNVAGVDQHGVVLAEKDAARAVGGLGVCGLHVVLRVLAGGGARALVVPERPLDLAEGRQQDDAPVVDALSHKLHGEIHGGGGGGGSVGVGC